MHSVGDTPGDCGSWQTPMKLSGNMVQTRWTRSFTVRLHWMLVRSVAEVVPHPARGRREERHVRSALALQPELAVLDGLAYLVVADRQRLGEGASGALDLAGAPLPELARRRRVVAVHVDDHARILRHGLADDALGRSTMPGGPLASSPPLRPR